MKLFIAAACISAASAQVNWFGSGQATNWDQNWFGSQVGSWTTPQYPAAPVTQDFGWGNSYLGDYGFANTNWNTAYPVNNMNLGWGMSNNATMGLGQPWGQPAMNWGQPTMNWGQPAAMDWGYGNNMWNTAPIYNGLDYGYGNNWNWGTDWNTAPADDTTVPVDDTQNWDWGYGNGLYGNNWGTTWGTGLDYGFAGNNMWNSAPVYNTWGNGLDYGFAGNNWNVAGNWATDWNTPAVEEPVVDNTWTGVGNWNDPWAMNAGANWAVDPWAMNAGTNWAPAVDPWAMNAGANWAAPAVDPWAGANWNAGANWGAAAPWGAAPMPMGRR